MGQKLIVVVPCQREYKYTFDLHTHFFPYQFSLEKHFENPNARIQKVKGDWLYPLSPGLDMVAGSGHVDA